MTCESITEIAPLYLYGELAPEDEEHLEVHMDQCAACRSEVERFKSIGRILDRRALEPTQALLVECREGLLRSIERSDSPAAGWLGLKGLFHSASRPVAGLRYLGAAAAMVALGFIAARVTSNGTLLGPARPGGTEQTIPAGIAPGVISGVQYTPAGQVKIDYDEVNHRQFSGLPEDKEIQALLLRAVREQADPGVRVESIMILKDHSASAPVRNALLHVLGHDSNTGVRLKALEGLREYSDEPEVRQVLVKALMDDANPGVRIQAIDLLSADHDEDLVGVFQAIVQKDQNNYVRMKCKNALREMNASVGAF